MITNFEEITKPLNSAELESLPYVIDLLKSLKVYTSSLNCVYSLNVTLQKNHKKLITQVQFRKIINLLRSESVLPIIATKKGYMLSLQRKVLKTQIRSLHERSEAILNAARGLELFL